MTVLLEQSLSQGAGGEAPFLVHAVPDGWLPLLVRTEDYLHVATLIASREAQRQQPRTGGESAPRHAPSADEAGLVPPSEFAPELHLLPWPVEQLRKLLGSSVTTAQRWVKAIDVLVEHEGRLLSSQQIADRTGMPIAAWRDAPRKITRHLQAHYDVPGWPLYAVGGRELGREDQVYWGISAEQAARWRQARNGSAEADV